MRSKGGTEGVGWYTYPKDENSMAVCGFGKNLTSQGLHAVFKCDLLARAG